MRCFGHLLEPECAKGLVVLDEFDSGLKFQELPPVPLRQALCGGEHCASDALSTRGLSYGNLADVDAIVSKIREGAPDEIQALSGNDESLLCGLGPELVNAHPCQRRWRIDP